MCHYDPVMIYVIAVSSIIKINPQFHNFTLVKEQRGLDVRKYSFTQRTINVWNNLSTDCVHDSNVQVKNRQVFREGGLHLQ